MSRPSRYSGLHMLGLITTLVAAGLGAGCGSNTSSGMSDGPTWSLADKKPNVALEQPIERNALGAKVGSSQPLSPPTSIIEVRKGDTLHGLALQHQLSIKALVEANNLTSHTIRPGQKLTVPVRPK